MTRPVYLALPEGPTLDAARSAAPEATVLPPPEEGPDLEGRDPGLLVIAGTTSLGDALEMARRLSSEAGWMLATLVEEEGAGTGVRTLSFGRLHRLGEVASGREEEADRRPRPLLDLHVVLREVARARHDLNNPLTSAMAETQLALLDAPEGEVREGLEVVQAQLRRLRDLIAGTGHLKPFED